MAGPWNANEIDTIVSDYFEMLACELRGDPFNKTEHRKALLERLPDRSGGSIEYKHQNISAVLVEAGAPYITGYKPGRNYQKGLFPEAIYARLDSDRKLSALMESDVAVVPPIPLVERFADILVKPPEPAPPPMNAVGERPAFYARRKVDYLEREAANQKLGAAGEEYALNLERARLLVAGKESLSDRVEHTSVMEGDGAGFDIRSFDEDGRDRFIEVKTTKYGAETPFYVTANEFRFSVVNSSNYYVYRLFGFRKSPKLFTLPGNIAERAGLSPQVYLARVQYSN